MGKPAGFQGLDAYTLLWSIVDLRDRGIASRIQYHRIQARSPIGCNVQLHPDYTRTPSCKKTSSIICPITGSQGSKYPVLRKIIVTSNRIMVCYVCASVTLGRKCPMWPEVNLGVTPPLNEQASLIGPKSQLVEDCSANTKKTIFGLPVYNIF